MVNIKTDYKNFINIIIVLFLMLCVSGCASNIKKKSLKLQKSLGIKNCTITMIAKSTKNISYNGAKKGASDAAEIIFKRTGVKVNIDWKAPENEDPAIQAKNIYEAVSKGTDGILISCSDRNKVLEAINYAVSKGVAVMTYDSDAPGSGRFSFYGIDDVKAGHILMDQMAEALNEEGLIAVLAGNPNAPNLKKRVRGVLMEAEKYPGIKIIGIFNNLEDTESAKNKVIEINNKYPNLNGWVMLGGWAMYNEGLLDYLKSKKSNIKIVAVNALPSQLQNLNDGFCSILLAQQIYKWGYVGVSTVFEKIYYKEAVPEYIEMDMWMITKENIADWSLKLIQWGYDDPVLNKFLESDSISY